MRNVRWWSVCWAEGSRPRENLLFPAKMFSPGKNGGTVLPRTTCHSPESRNVQGSWVVVWSLNRSLEARQSVLLLSFLLPVHLLIFLSSFISYTHPLSHPLSFLSQPRPPNLMPESRAGRWTEPAAQLCHCFMGKLITSDQKFHLVGAVFRILDDNSFSFLLMRLSIKWPWKNYST